MDTQPKSLRERKKLATRNALIATARRLFAEKGYEKTTLEDICAEVQIHITTFFSYFDSKEELAFARTVDMLEQFRQQMRDRPRDVDVTTFWWHFVNEFSLRARTEESTIMARMDEIPALRGRYANIVRQYEEELANALAEEAGADPVHDLYSRLKAAVLLAAIVTGARWYVDVFGEETFGIDAVVFTQFIMESFPSRKQFLPQQNRFTTKVRRKFAEAQRSKKAKRPKN